jgi:hypothetical protein
MQARALTTWRWRRSEDRDLLALSRRRRDANLTVGQHSRAYLPYIAALLIGLLLIILFPELSLFLPRVAGAIR